MGDMADDADSWAEAKNNLEELHGVIKGNIHGPAIRLLHPSSESITLDAVIKTKQAQYAINKTSPVGSRIACPSCGVKFIKTTYNKIFCSNQKTTKRSNNCKDRYWHYTDLTRRDRAINGA